MRTAATPRAVPCRSKQSPSFSPWPIKIRYRETVAHLSIEVLEKYALKELSETEKLRVEEHVARCQKCRDHLGEELGWSAAMRSPFMAKVRKMIARGRRRRNGEAGVVCAAGRRVWQVQRALSSERQGLALALIVSPPYGMLKT